jgi:8-oxo-dGTP pyrophosphatase MutT (NUDIX family)
LGVRFPSGAPMSKIKREFSAGGAVYKKEKDKILWLIIQPSAKDQPWRQGRWQLPKGWIDEGESGQQAAIREVKEEGGVEAEIIERADRINIFFQDEHKQKVMKNIVFFLMEYQKGSVKDHESETEKAVWLPFPKAYQRLTFKSEKGVLAKAKALLKKREEQPKLL